MWNEEERVPPHCTGWPWSPSLRGRFRNRMGYAAWEAYMRPVLRIINRYRTAWELQPLHRSTDTISPYAQISQLCPELDFPRQALSPSCHFVGPLAAMRPRHDDGFPWEQLDGRPLIFASLGTVRTDQNLPVLRRIAKPAKVSTRNWCFRWASGQTNPATCETDSAAWRGIPWSSNLHRSWPCWSGRP